MDKHPKLAIALMLSGCLAAGVLVGMLLVWTKVGLLLVVGLILFAMLRSPGALIGAFMGFRDSIRRL